MADPSDQTVPTITDGQTVIHVAPEQVFQKGPPPKPHWELSFVGHVLYVVALSCIIVFGVIAGVGVLLATVTGMFG